MEAFNARWLAAWSAKDVEALLGFYTPDTLYFDQQTAAGIQGHAALGAYLTGLFGMTPPMRYEPEEVWLIKGGFCGRWYCTIGDARHVHPFGRQPFQHDLAEEVLAHLAERADRQAQMGGHDGDVA